MSYVRKQLRQAAAEGKPKLPTYQTIAEVLEKKNGSGLRLVGWTVARTFLIMPGMLAVGVPVKKAFIGSLLSSGLISVLALVRIYNAGFQEDAEKWTQLKRERKLRRVKERQARQLGRLNRRRAQLKIRNERRRKLRGSYKVRRRKQNGIQV